MLSDIALLKLKVAAAVVALVGLAMGVLWYGEWRADAEGARVTDVYEAAIAKQKLEAGRLLREAGDTALRLERELNTAHTRLEDMGHERETITAGYERRLAAAAAAHGGRLRDPNAAGCGGGGGGTPPEGAGTAGAGEGDAAPAGGVLSAQLTGLLQRLTGEADAVNNAYAVCRQDSIDLRAALQLSPP